MRTQISGSPSGSARPFDNALRERADRAGMERYAAPPPEWVRRIEVSCSF